MASNGHQAFGMTSGLETLERTSFELPRGFPKAPGLIDTRRAFELPPLTGAAPKWLRNYWQVTSLGDHVATSYYCFQENGKIRRTATRPTSRYAAPPPNGATDAESGTFGLDAAGTIYVRWAGGDLERIVLGDDGPRSGAAFGLRSSKNGEASLIVFGALGFTLKPNRARRAVNFLPFASRITRVFSHALESAHAFFGRSALGGEGQ